MNPTPKNPDFKFAIDDKVLDDHHGSGVVVGCRSELLRGKEIAFQYLVEYGNEDEGTDYTGWIAGEHLRKDKPPPGGSDVE